MKTRLTWAAVLSIVLIPMLAIGWLDPLEGLPLVVLGTVLVVAVRLLSKVRIPKFTWISYAVVAGLMIVTLTIAMIQWPLSMAQQAEGEIVMNPLMNGPTIAGIPIMIMTMWMARVADLVLAAGLIFYSLKVFRARKSLAAE